MPHQMKAGVVCQKKQRETAALGLKDCKEWVLLLEVIINFALPLRVSSSEDYGVQRAYVQCSPGKLSAHFSCFRASAALHEALRDPRAWVQAAHSNHSHWTCLKWGHSKVPPPDSVPHHTYSGRATKGWDQLITMTISCKGWCKPSHLLTHLACRSRACHQQCAYI